MTEEKRIRDALLPVGLDVESAGYSGENPTYMVFNFSSRGENFADDEPQNELFLIAVHLFAPMDVDITAFKDAIKNCLIAAGFTYPTIEDVSDDDVRHVVFECEDERSLSL